jgi:hypothetical protein
VKRHNDQGNSHEGNHLIGDLLAVSEGVYYLHGAGPVAKSYILICGGGVWGGRTEREGRREGRTEREREREEGDWAWHGLLKPQSLPPVIYFLQ